MYSQLIAWILAIVLNVLWLFIFIPQLYINYKTKSSHAISLLLILSLFFGEILSVISAIAKELNNAIIFTIFYHIILNLILIFQIIYYRIMERVNERTTNERTNRDTTNEWTNENINYDIIYNIEELSFNNELTPLLHNFRLCEYKFLYFSKFEFIFLIVIFINVLLSIIFFPFIKSNLIITNLIAWLATFIFTLSRVPQIVLNLKRKSTEGLSLTSFIILNISNLLFLSTILILLLDIPKEQHLEYIQHNIQWIIGVFSSFIMDLIIFYQFYKYKTHIFLVPTYLV